MSTNDEMIKVRNPRTGEFDYDCLPISNDALKQLCDEKRKHQRSWSERGLAHRISVLLEWACQIEEFAQQIGDAEAVDTGRQRLSHEVPYMVAAGIRDWCAKAPAILASGQRSGTSVMNPQVKFDSQLVPFSLVGMITPWNHPFLLATLDAIPALIAGCAVVVKPSEIAPRFITPLMESVLAVPELSEVLSFIPGGARTGQLLIDQVDAVCFTGSIATGHKIALACAGRLIPAFLELGGKDAAVVTQTADLERAATAILRASTFASGQICFSTERVYVHESVHDRFVDLLIEKSNVLKLSYPDPRRGHLGPFIFDRQAEIVDAHIDDAVARGAKIVVGGKSEVLGGGMYMRATVLTNVDHSMKIMTDETFAPVTPVMKYRTEEDAIRLANDSDYGLSAAVFAATEDEAVRIACRLEAGAITLQDAAITIFILRDAEKTSFKSSGIGGSRMGPNSILRFFLKKALITNHGSVSDMQFFSEEGGAVAR